MSQLATDTSLGLLELLGSGAGFIRRPEAGYLPSDDDIYVNQNLIDKFGLRTGDELAGAVGDPPSQGKSPPLRRLLAVNGQPPESLGRRPRFERLSALHPREQYKLECGLKRQGSRDFTNRVIDLLCPLGKGQRMLIVAPAKAGKTMVLQAMAEGIVTNQPAADLFILLVDERPEEVTEMENIGFGEVISSSFDYPADRHVSVAELTLERARRRVEMGRDVVLVLDSITRLARAYNTVEDGTGKTLSGGLDAGALEKPKRFFGSARNIADDEGGGSLTIIGTALIETGSRMDDVIFEEFKGTGEELRRDDPSYSLRQVAGRVGIQPSYLSQIERDRVPPPGEETMVRLAEELDLDPDVVLALGGKVSSDLKEAIRARPKLFAELIRRARELPDDAVLSVVREVRDGEW
ncbi:MAG: transcription termination factor Rho [Gemmatimonadota bacterium]